jgi:hypothetical protein
MAGISLITDGRMRQPMQADFSMTCGGDARMNMFLWI